MSKDRGVAFSIIFLSISIIISASIVSKGTRNNGENVFGGLTSISGGLTNIANTMNNINNTSVVSTRNTYNLFTAASYLGITEAKLKEIVNNKDSGIPYIKIGEDYIFSKGALEKWLETARVEIK